MCPRIRQLIRTAFLSSAVARAPVSESFITKTLTPLYWVKRIHGNSRPALFKTPRGTSTTSSFVTDSPGSWISRDLDEIKHFTSDIAPVAFFSLSPKVWLSSSLLRTKRTSFLLVFLIDRCSVPVLEGSTPAHRIFAKDDSCAVTLMPCEGPTFDEFFFSPSTLSGRQDVFQPFLSSFF